MVVKRCGCGGRFLASHLSLKYYFKEIYLYWTRTGAESGTLRTPEPKAAENSAFTEKFHHLKE